MNLIRMIIWKEFRQIRADPLILRLMIMPVLLQMFVLGYAITTEVKNTTLVIVDKSNSTHSRSLIQTIAHNPLFKYRGLCTSENEARKRLDFGDARLALIIPSDFSLWLNRGGDVPVGLLVDGQDANLSNVASGYLNAIVMGWSVDYLTKRLGAMGMRIEQILPLTVRPVILFNPMLKSTWYMVPALTVILITIVTALLTGFSIVKEKESGTLEQLLVTPLSPVHIVFGKVVPFIIIGLIEMTVILAIATLWFGVPFRGNFPTLLVFGLVYMGSSLGLGILTSTIARTPQQVLFLTFFLLIFFLLLSGFFIPIENMPPWVQKVTYINPLRYFMFVLREMFLKGSGFAELWKQGLAMLAIGVTVFGCALLSFQRKMS